MASFFTSYVTAALATLQPASVEYSPAKIEPRTMAQMKTDCERFQSDNSNDLAFIDKAQAGRLFWVHRNGYMPEIPASGTRSQRLTDAAKAFGPYALSVDDDGVIIGG